MAVSPWCRYERFLSGYTHPWLRRRGQSLGSTYGTQRGDGSLVLLGSCARTARRDNAPRELALLAHLPWAPLAKSGFEYPSSASTCVYYCCHLHEGRPGIRIPQVHCLAWRGARTPTDQAIGANSVRYRAPAVRWARYEERRASVRRAPRARCFRHDSLGAQPASGGCAGGVGARCPANGRKLKSNSNTVGVQASLGGRSRPPGATRALAGRLGCCPGRGRLKSPSIVTGPGPDA